MKIAIAWRADTENEFCTNVVEAFRLAGVNVTVLPQVKASHIDYEGSSVSANQLDADGIGYLSNDAGLLVRAKAYDGSNVAVGRQHGVDEKILKHIANAYRLVFNGGTSLSRCPTAPRSDTSSSSSRLPSSASSPENKRAARHASYNSRKARTRSSRLSASCFISNLPYTYDTLETPINKGKKAREESL